MKMLVASSSYKIARAQETAAVLEPAVVLPLWKRVIDVGCCLLALPALCVGTLIMVLITRTCSPGPVLFCQERVGYRGRRFKLYKFRTMHVRADHDAHQMYFAQIVRANAPMRKLDGQGDRRLIPGGKLLRATGLDELPQIINVLRREMSIVGPRPCIPYELAQYSAVQRERFEAAPGLTGLWQVSGKNGTTFDEMVELDVRYLRSRSFAADLKIICRTIPTLWQQVMESRRKGEAIKSASSSAVVKG